MRRSAAALVDKAVKLMHTPSTPHLKQERTTGSIEAGKGADFIVLDRDIFSLDPFDLHDTKVIATYLDGREVYSQKKKWSCAAFGEGRHSSPPGNSVRGRI